MFAARPGDAVVPVEVGVAHLVGAFGVGAETAVSGQADNAGNSVFKGGPVGPDLQPELAHDVIFRVAAGIKRIHVMEEVETETGIVHQRRRNNSGIGNHRLPCRNVQHVAIQEKRGRRHVFVVPAVSAKPGGCRVLHEIDALGELILVAGVILQVQKIAGEAAARNVGQWVVREQRLGNG